METKLFDRHDNKVIADCLFTSFPQFRSRYPEKSEDVLKDVYIQNRRNYGRATAKYQPFFVEKNVPAKLEPATIPDDVKEEIIEVWKTSSEATQFVVDTIKTIAPPAKKESKPKVIAESAPKVEKQLDPLTEKSIERARELIDSGMEKIKDIRKIIHEEFPTLVGYWHYDRVYFLQIKMKKEKETNG